MIAVRAVRGAVQVDRDDPDVIFDETCSLVLEVIRRNDLALDDIISIFFTMTPDLASGFPAAAARAVGLTDVPMLCATEIGVPNSMERVVRLLAHIQTDRPPAMVEHVYLRGAVKLRPDLVRERRPGTRGPGGSTATG
ncbi:chorismate mutase [Actinophytocola xinjiangensis]|uniref:chorismate mutase n=1 Tax=Actinophytocola xinjiangensis TaxID=485602 RepID=UPI001473BD66|nr:chorismate mutase [Actinophytocola xinjiangensis]